MLALFGLEALCKAECLLYASFAGGGDGIESVCVDGVIVGAQFGQRKDSFIHFPLDDFIIRQLFPQDCHLCLE